MNEVLLKCKQTTLEDLPNTTSLQELEAGVTRSDLQDGVILDLFARPVYPANHSALQERKKELMTNDTCYRTLSNSLSSAISQQFLANKYQAQSNTAGSMIYVLKWSEKSTPLGRSYSQQQARVRPISDKDCTGWPTASTRDHKGGDQGGRIRNGKLSIDTLDVAAQLAGYPTPKTGTGGANHNSPQVMAGNHGINLEGMAHVVGWVSPVACDWKARGPNSKQQGLPEQARYLTGWLTPSTLATGERSEESMEKRTAARLATGRTSISPGSLSEQVPMMIGQTQTGYTAETKSTGQLNPALSRWLMGFPEEWDIAAIQASRLMPTTRKKRELCV